MRFSAFYARQSPEHHHTTFVLGQSAPARTPVQSASEQPHDGCQRGVQMGGRPRSKPEAVAGSRASALREIAATLATSDHLRLRTRLVELGETLETLMHEDADRHAEVLVPLWSAYAGLSRDVHEHLRRVDEDFLPAIEACEAATDGDPAAMAAGGPALERALRVQAVGHSVIRSDLVRLRDVTRGYAPPEAADSDFRALFYGLAALERDVEARLVSEREVLMPAAVALTRARRQPG
jgi:regulator of cell morphogenesis and NO signaling